MMTLQRKTSFLAVVIAASLFTAGCTQKATVEQKNLLSEPLISQQMTEGDFSFPPAPPSLMDGKHAYDKSCVACHSVSYWQTDKVKKDLAYTTPIDLYILMTSGQAPDVVMPSRERKQVLPATHPSFRDKLSRDERWAVIMFTRYLAGAGDIQSPTSSITVASIFGGNCAVCHGTRGQADGPLYIGNPQMGEAVHQAPIKELFEPPPANFTEYQRVYNRTDAQLFRYICQGIYPSAMPSWYGNVDHDAASGKVDYVFDDFLIWNLVRHVRTFTYNDDLSANPANVAEMKTFGVDPASPPKGLTKLDACPASTTNHPWNDWVRKYGPKATEGADNSADTNSQDNNQGHVAP